MSAVSERGCLQRLWWKELRQLMPLVALLPVLVVVVLGFQWLTAPGSTRPWFGSVTLVLCLGMPSLFACGAGALLVGYEKELRTLGWLTNLPIAAHRIVRVKVLAALVGLVVLWLLGVLILAFASVLSPHSVAVDDPTQWVWLSHSLYVLLAGFALAWWSRSALMALLMVVPAAAFPYAVALLIDGVWGSGTGRSRLALGTLLACQAVGVAAAWWLGERWGRRALAAQAPAPAAAMRQPAGGRLRSSAVWWADVRVQRPAAALVWQFARQSRAVLAGTSIMLATTVAVLGAANDARGSGVWLSAAMVLGFLAINWLGVAVFQSDGLGGRIRFLSDRGITAPVIWMTRQAIPLSLLALFALLLAAISIITAEPAGQNWDAVGVAFAVYSIAALVIFLSAQWLGQVVFSPIVAAVAAPLVAVAVISYGGFAIEVLGTPWWLVLLLLPVPALATLIMTRRWMDRRLGIGYWAGHGGFLAATCILPAVPLLVAVLRQPAMPDSIARQLQQEMQAWPGHASDAIELVAGRSDDREQEAVPGAEALLASIDEQLRATPLPVGASSGRIVEQLRSVAVLSRMALQQEATGATAGAADSAGSPQMAGGPAEGHPALRRYRRATSLLLEIAQRLRASPRLVEQDMADLVEIWLLSERMREAARERFGDPLYDAVGRMLADRDARREARMRAVALSWQAYDSATRRGQQSELGGYQLPAVDEGAGMLQHPWIARRRVGLAVADLWQLASGEREAATPQRIRRIADFWDRPPAYYGLGPDSHYLRADDLDRFLQPSLSPGPPAIAGQWSADWERVAATREP